MNANPKPGDARVRFTMATIGLSTIHTTGQRWGADEEVIRENGFRDFNEFWEVAFSEPMEPSKFADLVAILHRHPARLADERDGRAVSYAQLIGGALRAAFESGENWFFRTPGGELRLRPRPAAEWFLSNPQRRDHLPAELIAYLTPTQAHAAAPTKPTTGAPIVAPKHRPGKAPEVFDRVVSEMREYGIAQVCTLKQVSMETEFRASRETCKKARDFLLSELQRQQNSDKTPTIDK